MPAGKQIVVVWQEAAGGPITAGTGDPVTIKAGDTTDHDVTMRPDQVKAGQSPGIRSLQSSTSLAGSVR